MSGKFFCIVLLLVLSVKTWSQNGCTTLGQTPATAFPVCGTSVFKQDTVPVCVNNTIPAESCGTYADNNPFWYQFTCYSSGTLAFLIAPVNSGDDYDWQLFDITGHNPGDVYTDQSLTVIGNWSGTFGNTGARAGGSTNIECGSNPPDMESTFSTTPELTQGHTYLLIVSHFSGSDQSGYSLSFGGGTAVITDTVKPAMQTASVSCDAKSIDLKLDKKVKCASLSNNGSEFYILPNKANVVSAAGTDCSASFDMDSVIINLDKAMPPGNYFLKIKNGKDLNTLLDNCDNAIDTTDSIPFIVTPKMPTAFDSIQPINCRPDTLRFVFTNSIKCNSVAADGSDFSISGTTPASIKKAFGDACSNGVSNIIDVVLNQPILINGSYTVTLKTGTDGNTLIDECGELTPAGETVSFTTADTVSADFFSRVGLGCVYDTLFYAHDGKDHTNEWDWTFGSEGTSTTRDSFFLFNDYGSKHIQLFASNSICNDSSSTDINLDNQLKARFTMAPSTTLCPEDEAVYTDSSTGKIVSWYWNFGDGTTSVQKNPAPKKYAPIGEHDARFYPVALIVKNDINCFDTAQIRIKVLYNCYIAVPTAFTPNGDGLNDYLYPLNAYKADELEFKVYNRYGQMVFETKDWTKKWDGRINGTPQASGTYVWFLNYTEHDTGKKILLKGTSVLIR